MIYVLKVTANQERVVAEILYREARAKRKEIEGEETYAILYTTGLKGYVLVEADSPGTVEELARNVPKTKGLLRHKRGDIESAGTISIEELRSTLLPTPIVEELNKGDLIELVSGPFKGEKARVARIDKDKNEITVELIEAAVPIPVIVKGDDIKIVKKENEAEENE
ncbi:MAG: transcription elongation factor Spt5 [Candidatus Altiarchaeales archaeon]|nr:transcription elongation factor Spt5 [Candidatus Altiarchaeota archaeon]MBU4341953.1 transcription elongation factor Spt5 [Candidatus Altiarchaeota archaeon]MBU4406381.1 transcription elongation factor Spt5 [Candidatus Altiarchaeota archaeon]MBU4436767.1 transcription elongation factor Spt5 [Candidatus Altiarchaeota archaeon]MCG2783259.1 transcription elongation factor Spt5 [Candidatus Altiarchaeales archaeon]